MPSCAPPNLRCRSRLGTDCSDRASPGSFPIDGSADRLPQVDVSDTASGYTKIALLLLLAVVVLGVAVTRQFGESWDEQQFFKYANRALQAYSSWWQTGTVPITGNTYDNYGPAYVMLVATAARLLGLLLPWTTSDLRHLVYFAAFVVGLWAFNRLCRRWLGRAAALGATLLLATQPLIWGHAFISPKDLPFLTFFVLTVRSGLRLADSVAIPNLDHLGPDAKRRLLILTAAWALLLLGILVSTPLVSAWIRNLVTSAAGGQSNIVARVASDIRTANPDLYIQKFFVYYLRARAGVVLASVGGLALLWRKAPSVFRFTSSVAPAAILLGLTTSIRILGPLAGLIVCAYAGRKSGRKALPLIVAYTIVAAAATYATWPYLWPDPVGRFLESATLMARYPWKGQVLFDGAMYLSTQLPPAYLPTLLAIQLTEPLWILFGAGLLITSIRAINGSPPALGLLSLTLAWLVLPLLVFVITHFALYDNFRQALFILPPVFIVSGVVFDKIRPLPLQAALIALVVLPGLVDGARLHPYEYIYYNRFVGGDEGAFRSFEMDYWGTSYREAAAYLNQEAAANSNVWVEGPTHLLQVYVRPDLKIYSTYEVERADHYDYVVALTRSNLDLQAYPDAPVVHSVEREGAILTVIKKP